MVATTLVPPLKVCVCTEPSGWSSSVRYWRAAAEPAVPLLRPAVASLERRPMSYWAQPLETRQARARGRARGRGTGVPYPVRGLPCFCKTARPLGLHVNRVPLVLPPGGLRAVPAAAARRAQRAVGRRQRVLLRLRRARAGVHVPGQHRRELRGWTGHRALQGRRPGGGGPVGDARGGRGQHRLSLLLEVR